MNGTFSFRKGPIFCNVLLADEINRASPRTQSALLEAMSERQATIEGRRYPLPEPFLVIATENPVEFHGTYPLPEAQLDRFQVQIRLGYPDFDTEVEILYDQQDHHPLEDLSPVLSREELLALQRLVRTVTVDRSVSEYLVRISRETRQDPRLALGVSPRGSLLLFRSAQARALLDGRSYVLPDDVRAMVPHVLPHRLVLTAQARYSGVDKGEIVDEIVCDARAGHRDRGPRPHEAARESPHTRANPHGDSAPIRILTRLCDCRILRRRFGRRTASSIAASPRDRSFPARRRFRPSPRDEGTSPHTNPVGTSANRDSRKNAMKRIAAACFITAYLGFLGLGIV